MKYVECATQAALDKALANRKSDEIVVCTGGTWDRPLAVSDSASVEAYGSASVEAYGSASVVAYDSASVVASGSASVVAYGSASVVAYDSASVEAYGSASVVAYDSASVVASGSASVEAYGSASVEAYDSASVRAYDSASVEAYGSASVEAYDSASVVAYGSASVVAYDSASVVAYDSASVRAYDSASVVAYGSASVVASGSASVEAYGSASVEAYGSASVEASKYVAIHKHPNGQQKITGGVVIEIPPLNTVQAWLDYYGVEVKRGVAVLYKAVDDTYGANHNGFKYEPGTTPAALDWNDRPVCGSGLHFCARPLIARDRYHPKATRYIGCPVKVAELVVIDDTKVKAPRVYKPCFEVDKHGDPVAGSESEKAA